MTKNLIQHIEGLEVTQGEGLGGPLRLFPWERRFLRTRRVGRGQGQRPSVRLESAPLRGGSYRPR